MSDSAAEGGGVPAGAAMSDSAAAEVGARPPPYSSASLTGAQTAAVLTGKPNMDLNKSP